MDRRERSFSRIQTERAPTSWGSTTRDELSSYFRERGATTFRIVEKDIFELLEIVANEYSMAW
jgi:hypothetical protein